MKNYSVRKFCDMVGVPYSSLRYFERIGLLKPAKDKDNNYRAYTPMDAFLLNRFKFFRSLDFDVKEALELVQTTDRDYLINKITDKENQIRDQVLILNEKLKFMDNYKKNIKLSETEDVYEMGYMKDKLFLPASVGNDFSVSDYKLFSKWVELLPITSYSKRIRKSDIYKQENVTNDFGISIDLDNMHFLNGDLSEEVEFIKGGRCITFCTSKLLYPFVDMHVINKALDYIKSNDLTIAGDIYIEGLSTINDDGTRSQIVNIPVE